MPPVTTKVVLQAPAKLTLSLRITGVRADGYHLVDAEMVSLDLADTVELDVTQGPPGGASRLLEVVDGASGQSLGAELGHDNLVLRALAMANRSGQVRIVKHIPAGAGLGGGSSDAAAVLAWAGLDDPQDAASIGADVPFCVAGGRARVGGIGELVEPLPFEDRTFTLLMPPFGCSTPAVYRRWDELGGPRDERDGPVNDLEPAALSVEPRLVEWRDRLGAATGLGPRLAGSGSTWFVEGAFPGEGRVVARTTPGRRATPG
jgi:4-diphosphocytidyl-2-C-methyl-D-erythritol kinase